jgi:hypothetical protein
VPQLRNVRQISRQIAGSGSSSVKLLDISSNFTVAVSVAPLIGDTSLTHVMRLAAHSTTSPTPTAMGQSFLMTLYIGMYEVKFFILNLN